MRRVILSVALPSLAACAASQAPAAPSAIAPPPFTAAEIRDATAAGRTYRFRIEQPGQVPMIREMRFSNVSTAGCTIEGQMYDEEGGLLGEPTVQQSTWEELVGHASYPQAATTIREEPCSVPVGQFSCKVYTVSETKAGVETVTVAHFAAGLPGAPVRLEVTEDGISATTWTLLEHEPGRSDETPPVQDSGTPP